MRTTLCSTITLLIVVILIFLPDSFAQQPYSIPEPVPPPLGIREAFNLDRFYQQWIDIDGFPILASRKVSPYAVKEVAWLIHQITRHSPAALQAMVKNKVRFSIIAHNERTTEIPEHSIHPKPHFFYDVRNRGGYCPRCLTVSAPEETVLDEGWYSVIIHEFAHAFHEAGLNTIDPTFENKLRTTYNEAMALGLWQNTYSSTNMSEYWAQGVGTWFHANPEFKIVTTRTALENYDPGLASLLAKVFGDSPWRYTLPATRTHLPHLRGFNPQDAPRLQHPPELLETYRQFTSNPDNDGEGKWVNLEPYDPSRLPSLNKSKRTEDFVSIYFMNHTGATVSVYQVHPDGKEIHRGNVIHKNFIELGANIGSILLVKDDTGEKLVVFLVDESVHGFIARAFVGEPTSVPAVAVVPTTGTSLAINKPPELTRDNFTIGPGEFAILTHNRKQVIMRQADFKIYTSYFTLAKNSSSADIPDLASFFQNGGRIELVSHPTLNPLPQGSGEAQFGDVVISEILWSLDDASPTKQWIELYNASAHTYSFTDGDLSLRFSKISEAPFPNGIFTPPHNPNAAGKVIDRVSNKDWKVPGQSGNISGDQPLISMYRTIDYTTGSIPDGTLASSWRASNGRVNLLPPSYGTPGAKHLPPAPVVHVGISEHPPMYWVNTETGTLHRLIGDEVENLAPSIRNATSLAVDAANRKLYWVEKTGDHTGRIRRANLDGSNIQLVKDLTSVPFVIALDTAAGKLYLTNFWGKVQRLDINGSNFQPNLITNLETPKYLALDIAGGQIYWTEQTSNATGKIRRANLDGSNIQLVKDLTSAPRGLTLDPTNRKLYLTNAWGKIQRLNLDGSDFQPNFITDLEAPGTVAVDVGDATLYWTEPDRIRRANLNGKNIREVVTDLGAPTNITFEILLERAVVAAAPAKVAIPEQTLLLSNYPNPFNPETWIPYQLAKPADVTLRIYAANGALVRTLVLGHQPAGIYRNRSRAAYWDGRNQLGESVASGIYFYTLSAGDFTATRKMLIMK